MFEHENDTIAAVCTGAGGAVSIVRISGPRALEVVRSVWRGRRLPGPDCPRVMLYGRLVSAPDSPGEPSLAVFMPAPHSFTGEDVAELHCHGGSFAARRALRMALQAGARLAQNGEFTRRAFLNGKLDLTQAEAVLDLINAGRERAGLLAERQLNGAVGSLVRDIRAGIVHLLSEAESRLDFSEEDLDWMPCERFRDAALDLRKQARELALTARAGILIRDGVSLVIAGPPNAGKSSLLNRLLGYERAIVTPVPGTTRDTLEESVSIGGVRFRVTDTAGLRDEDRADPVEALGMKRSRESLGAADVVLWLLDASEPADTLAARLDEMKLAHSQTHAKFIPCWNKMDASALDPTFLTDTAEHNVSHLCASGAAHCDSAGVSLLTKDQSSVSEFSEGRSDPRTRSVLSSHADLPGLEFEFISARTGDGLDALCKRLEQTVWDGLPAAAQSGGAAVSERHASLLEQAAERLGSAADEAMAESWELAGSSLRNAAELVGCITGETATPDVLDEIFARFCIGK